MKKFKLNQFEKLSLAEAMEDSLNEVFIFDAEDFLFKYISKGALKNLGYSTSELKKMRPWDIKPITQEQFFQIINPLIKNTHQKIEFEISHIRRNKSTYPVEVHLQECMFGDRPCYLAFILDITKKKSLYEDLVHSSKLASLGEMAGGVAHEINNPLAIISGHMMHMRCLVDANDFSDKDIITIVQKVEQTVARISKIVKGMKSLSRDGSHDPLEKTEIKSIVSDSLSICSEKFKNDGISLIIDLPEDELFINCRKTEISQILINVLSNSYDAVKNADSPIIKVCVLQNGSKVQIIVEDNGMGIDKVHQKNILNPFYTTKKSGEGTGLGLSISKTLAENHNGSLFFNFDSKNTEVILELPLAKETSSTAA